MKQIETGKGKFIVVPVPDEAAIKKIHPWFSADIRNIHFGEPRTTSEKWSYINFYTTYKKQRSLTSNEGLHHIWNVELSKEGEQFEIIDFVSEILKDEEMCKKVVDSSKWHWPMEHDVYMNYLEPLKEPNTVSKQWRQEWNVSFAHATASFQSLCTKYELKETDLLIKKI